MTPPSSRASRSAFHDVIVIGAGIAGCSVAGHLAQHRSVCLLEMESQPGMHSTGRSAALFAQSYGNSTIRSLTRASRSFFHAPPPGFANAPLLRSRPVLITARADQAQELRDFISCGEQADGWTSLSTAEGLERCPVLRPDELDGGATLTEATADIDVNELQQGFLRLLRSRGGRLVTRAQVQRIERDSSGWVVSTTQETVRGAILVNAAGAWAGEIARLAGAQDLGLQPMRRTACLIDPPVGTCAREWPLIMNVAEEFYLKPDAGLLLLSPADETPTVPCDAQPDDLDVAIAVDRLERATTLEVRRVVRKWAGLRCFVADRSPVVGFDVAIPGFFWLAALGGFGIQTAPAISEIAAALILQKRPDEALLAHGVDVNEMAPGRQSLTGSSGSTQTR